MISDDEIQQRRTTNWNTCSGPEEECVNFYASIKKITAPDLDFLQAERAMNTNGRESSQAYSSSDGLGS